MAGKIENLAEIGESKKSAIAALEAILPKPADSDYYLVKPVITTKELADNRYLATTQYVRREEAEEKVKTTGTGAGYSALDKRLSGYQK